MIKYRGVTGEPPEIGSEKVFYPHALLQQIHVNVPIRLGADVRPVTGICDYVNEAHRFARYAYKSPGAGVRWECFKF